MLERGFDEELGSFVQSYDSKRLDASLLTIPLFGFLPADDPRVRGTLEAVRRELLVDGFVQRYRHDDERRVVDGLPPGEGAFFLCSFWFVDNLILLGELDEAREMFERLLSLRNDLGLLSEEYDPKLERLVGNFPQAFSHIGLVNTALLLDALCAKRAAPSPAHRCPKWCAAGSEAPTSLDAIRRASGPRLSSDSTTMLRLSLMCSKRPRTSRSGSPRTIARFRS